MSHFVSVFHVKKKARGGFELRLASPPAPVLSPPHRGSACPSAVDLRASWLSRKVWAGTLVSSPAVTAPLVTRVSSGLCEESASQTRVKAGEAPAGLEFDHVGCSVPNAHVVLCWNWKPFADSFCLLLVPGPGSVMWDRIEVHFAHPCLPIRKLGHRR